jgi:poly-gamma-glutamate synthesis protein (capsule biosynthesis protein)
MRYFISFFCLVIMILLAGCSAAGLGNEPDLTSASPTLTLGTQEFPAQLVPTQEKIFAPTKIELYIPPELEKRNDWTNVFSQVTITASGESFDCVLTTSHPEIASGEIVYALVAPFPTIRDGYSREEVASLLAGEPEAEFSAGGIVLTQEDLTILQTNFSIAENKTQIVEEESLINFLYSNPESLALIPFEQITPAVKVLAVGEISPFDQAFDSTQYFLTVPIGITCKEDATYQYFDKKLTDFYSNRERDKFTSVLLTGTTALVRATGSRMEQYGNQYPGEKIKEWFDEADISHISNEASFWSACPPADPAQKDTFFCSRPEYAELLTFLGVDVVELSGNHLVDKGVKPLEETFEILKDKGIPFYAAGQNQEQAEQAVKFQQNGNKIAFIGCNEAGPTFVWLDEYHSGVLRCDFERMAGLVSDLAAEGYLPIVTYQYWESFQFDAMPYQKNHSRQMIDAGAVIVSGSQSHLPMSMEVYKNGFIHYGLGNLFFDQMDIPVVGTRREFVDRHIFYDGKYLGTQIYTAMLEDYAQPRPMTDAERMTLLQDAFEYFRYIP